jgi:hypothetical protein
MFKRQLGVSRLLDLDHERHSPLGTAKRERLARVLGRVGVPVLEVAIRTALDHAASKLGLLIRVVEIDDGETIVVNLHGALIATAIGLSSGMRISIHVYLTDKRAAARVVYIDPKNPLHCGIELDEPQNIWGVSVPPDNWEETAALESGR